MTLIEALTMHVFDRRDRRRERAESYRDYLSSPEWRARADAAIVRANYRCQICNADRWFSPLQVHHRTYDRLGSERPEDLVVLCRHCHELFHRHGKLAR